MKNSFNILLFIFVFFLVCKAQGQTSHKDSIEMIAEPIEVLPFVIKRKSIYVNLPIKLSGIGMGIIKLYLNNKGEPINMGIQKLKIHFKNGGYIDFQSTDSLPKYPNQVKKYYHPLQKYIKDIKIVPVPNINIPPKTSVLLLVKFKQKPSL